MQKKYSKKIIFILLCGLLFLGMNQITLAFDNLAQQAISNNYSFYQEGKAVDGTWGNFTAFDGYLLSKAGVNIEAWEREDTNFKKELQELIAESLNEKSAAAKKIVEGYLLAKEWAEEELAEQLWGLLQKKQVEQANGSFDNQVYSDLAAFAYLSRAGLGTELEVEKILVYLLETQDSQVKAWPEGAFQDLQATAQAIQALGYFGEFTEDEELKLRVKEAITTGLFWLKERQKPDGSFLDEAGFDDPLIDSVEVLLTLQQLDLEPESWSSVAGYNVLDFLREQALQGINTVASNTWALEAALSLGVEPASEMALGLNMSQENIQLAVGEKALFVVEAIFIDGTKKEVTQEAEWFLEQKEIAQLEKTSEGVWVTRTAPGYFQIKVVYQSLSKNCGVKLINVFLRIEGPQTTILPTKEITVPADANYLDILHSGAEEFGYQIEIGESGFLEKINGQGSPDFYWLIVPYREIYQTGDSLVLSGNGSTNLGEIILETAEIKANNRVKLRVIYEDGEPVKEALVTYYSAEKPFEVVTAGYTDQVGVIEFKIKNKGTYFITAEKPNVDFVADSGLVRTPPVQLLVEEKSQSKPREDQITVKMLITGKNRKCLFSGKVTLNKGETSVFEALLKTKLPYEGDYTFITSIAGQRNQGLNGWMVKVNGDFILTSIGSYYLKEGDFVEWLYSLTPENKIKPEKKLPPQEEISQIWHTEVPLVIEVLEKEVSGAFKEIGFPQIKVSGENTSFTKPVALTIDLARDELKISEGALLCGIRYEKDVRGNWYPVKLGGVYDSVRKSFLFLIDKPGIYSLVEVSELREIVIEGEKAVVIVNNQEEEIEVSFYQAKGTFFLPLRFIAEKMGAEVVWQAETKMVEMHFAEESFRLVVGKTSERLPIAAEIKEGRTFVPLDYFANYWGIRVLCWPEEAKIELVA